MDTASGQVVAALVRAGPSHPREVDTPPEVSTEVSRPLVTLYPYVDRTWPVRVFSWWRLPAWACSRRRFDGSRRRWALALSRKPEPQDSVTLPGNLKVTNPDAKPRPDGSPFWGGVSETDVVAVLGELKRDSRHFEDLWRVASTSRRLVVVDFTLNHVARPAYSVLHRTPTESVLKKDPEERQGSQCRHHAGADPDKKNEGASRPLSASGSADSRGRREACGCDNREKSGNDEEPPLEAVFSDVVH